MSRSVTVVKIMNYCARVCGFGLLIKASMFLKASYLVGSQALFFSGSTITAPLAGALGGTALNIGVFFIRLLMSGAMGLSALALTLPGLCAGLYWRVDHWSVRVLLPLACFGAFVAHPVGGAAFAYALYWLIPVGIYFSSKKNMFSTALAATFTAHAVGSVIWLYTVPMTAAMWMALIPLVAVERLCFATGMVAVYQGIQWSMASIMRAKERMVYSTSADIA